MYKGKELGDTISRTQEGVERLWPSGDADADGDGVGVTTLN